MLSFHNDEKIKQKYLDRIRSHAAADEIIKGKYWENGKGCVVGCTIHSGNHSDYETELGIPMVLARLEDSIFESLPNELAMKWPERFLDAIPVGKDLSQVWPKFAIWILTDPKWGVLQFVKSDKTTESIKLVAKSYQQQLNGEKVDWIEIKYVVTAAAVTTATATAAAVTTATAAAHATAYAATASYPADADAAAAAADAAAAAADAAAAASYAAVYDATAVAYAAAAATASASAASYARSKWRVAQADKLIELLKVRPLM